MEKKVEVEIDGRKYRIAEHMLEDASRFGASAIKRQLREVPAELLKVPEIKKIVLPPKDPEPVKDPVREPVKNVRKKVTK